MAETIGSPSHVRSPETVAATRAEVDMPRVRADRIALGYRSGDGEEHLAVREATFDIGRAEMVCVVGPSGCGKSTILSAVAGLVLPWAGSLEVDGKPVRGPGSDRAVVFQKAALLPWNSVLDNVAYGLRSYGVRKSEARARATEMLALVGLESSAKKYPYQLSGGMQQRVNLARALAANPAILLFDEPFAALDAQQRETLQYELLRIWTQSAKAGLFITHQIDEAVLLGNRVLVSSPGPASTIERTIEIDLPWPRNHETRHHPNFAEYVEEIWQLVAPKRRARW